MSDIQQPQEEGTTRTFVIIVKSNAKVEVDAQYWQSDMQPVEGSITFQLTGEGENTISTNIVELTAQDAKTFLDDWFQENEYQKLGTRNFEATQESWNNNGVAGDGDGDSGSDDDDDFDFLDEGDDESDDSFDADDTEYPVDDDDDGGYALSR